MEPADPVAEQYEVFPYPDRDPADEARRLVEGSPSRPVEIDHFLFDGRRDWSRPFRALVAGGGTGDATVMLAQRLADIGCPAEIVHLDRSAAATDIARSRVAARGLASVRFVAEDIAAAPALGPFDYVDCCGVLHHLPDPDAGFRAVGDAIAPGGGAGIMVYAPLGRTGVYPLQEAFATLLDGLPAAERLAQAKPVVAALPARHWLRQNPFVGDHRASDAGLYDLLLHSRDRPYHVEDLVAALSRAGLSLVSMLESARYDPLAYLPSGTALAARVRALDPVARMAVAERLSGAIKVHVAYVARAGDVRPAFDPAALDPGDVLRLTLDPHALAAEVARKGRLSLTLDGQSRTVRFAEDPLAAHPEPAAQRMARLVGALDGASLVAIARTMPYRRGDVGYWVGEARRLVRALAPYNLVHRSRGGAP